MDGEENDSRVLIPGDLLWTKIGKYPFWPCMIAYDPLSGDYYRQIKSKDKIYIIYHVQYFGNNPLRGWTSRKKTFVYEGRQKFLSRIYDVSEKNKYAQSLYNVPNYYKKDWEIAITEAEEALEVTDVKERFASYVFSYENVKKKSLKTMHETSSTDVVENSQEVEQDRKKRKMKSTFKKKKVKQHTRTTGKKYNLQHSSCDSLINSVVCQNLVVCIEKIPTTQLALKSYISKHLSASNSNVSRILEDIFSSNIQDSSCETKEYIASDKADNNKDNISSNNNVSCVAEETFSSNIHDSSCETRASDQADNNKDNISSNNVSCVAEETFSSNIHDSSCETRAFDKADNNKDNISSNNNVSCVAEETFSSDIHDSSCETRASDKADNNKDNISSNNNVSCVAEKCFSSKIQGSSCYNNEYIVSDKADNNKNKSATNNNVSCVVENCFSPKIVIRQLRRFEICVGNKIFCRANELQLNAIRNVQNGNNYRNLHTCKNNIISISDQAPASKWSNYRPSGDSCGTDEDTEDSEEEEDDDDNSPATLPGHIVSFSKNYIYNSPVFHRCAEYNTKKGCRCLTCAVCNSENNIVLFCWTCPSSFCDDCRRNYAPLLFYMEDAPFLQRFIFYCQICAIKHCQDFIYKK